MFKKEKEERRIAMDMDGACSTVPSKTKKPFYKRKWFIAIIIIFILGIIGGLLPDDENNEADAPQKSKKEIFIEDFASENGIDKALAKSVIETSKAIGVNKKGITDVKVKENSLQYTYSGYYFNISFADNNVTKIKSGDIVFFNGGKAVKQVDDYMVYDSQRPYIITQVEMDVEDRLKAPSSAEFCSMFDYKVKRVKNKFTISGYVDAQNSFGAQIRSNFVAIYTWDGDTDNALILDDIVIE